MKLILPNACWAQAVGHRCLAAEARVRFLVSPYEIFGVQIGTGTSFSPVIRVFPLYHSIITSHLHTNPKGKRSKAGNFET
jgi:hypothetical protein